ncbi:hypothetical protein R1flu_027348 [Riccia fluitans]|uniref:Pectinesterase n=1 Tax=Riccia fluitans TaxID=41844 RepID=A0ABD1XIN4_9MARC
MIDLKGSCCQSGREMTGTLRYDAPDYHDQYSQNRAKRRRLCLVVGGVVVLVVLICAIAIPVFMKNKKDKNEDSGPSSNSGSTALEAACNKTRFFDLCMESLKDYPGANSTNPRELVKIALDAARRGVSEELARAEVLQKSNDVNLSAVAADCVDNLVDSLDSINQTLDRLDKWDSAKNVRSQLNDLQTWMSSALTLQQTCHDDFVDLNVTGPAADLFLSNQTRVEHLLSNALAFISILRTIADSNTGRRRLLTESLMDDPNEEWVKPLRRLLATNGTGANVTANVVVALDGSGQYTKIQDAVDKAPQKSNTRYVILIKAGTYKENVIVGKDSWNIMFIGEGQDKTFITASLSTGGNGITTSKTGTLSVLGKGFIGRDFMVENTAGAKNYQAVALHVGGDLVAFWRCTFKGYQDTLYTHTNRQFYKDCTVRGTVDFIFGNAACVLQDCNILADIGLPGQQNTITASGRMDPNQNTGISIQRCNIDGTPSFKNAATKPKTYLGRPWKTYALTVFIQSTLGNLVDPEGWLLWNGDTSQSKTVYYAEYKNIGPGSGVTQRVTWSYQISNPTDAQKFTPNSFLSASTWLNDTNIQYTGSL